MINFNTNNLIIVCYPGNAGGKFLINSLGLSDNAVFQSAPFAKEQLSGNFSQTDKINYLKNELDRIGDKWNDLNIGCGHFFGIDNEFYYQYPTDLIKSLLTQQIIDDITNSELKFFIVAHWPSICDEYIKVWPNAKIIYFKNTKDFISARYKNPLSSTWDIVRGVDWPVDPPASVEELNSLPDAVRKEFNTFFPKVYLDLKFRSSELDYYERSIINYPNSIVWDTNNYFQIDDTVNGIRNLYKLLNLNNFNEKAVQDYYIAWIDKLNKLRNT